VGFFIDPLAAAMAYDEAVKKINANWATDPATKLNFPPGADVAYRFGPGLEVASLEVQGQPGASTSTAIAGGGGGGGGDDNGQRKREGGGGGGEGEGEAVEGGGGGDDNGQQNDEGGGGGGGGSGGGGGTGRGDDDKGQRKDEGSGDGVSALLLAATQGEHGYGSKHR
jgi:hypothetical protein